jgi:hypothetical protein
LLEGLQVKVVLDLRFEHPDSEAETDDVNVNLLALAQAPRVGFDQEGFYGCLQKYG